MHEVSLLLCHPPHMVGVASTGRSASRKSAAISASSVLQRGHLLRLAPKGQRLLEKTHPSVAAVLDHITSDFSFAAPSPMTASPLSKQHKEDRRTWEQEVQNARHMAELNEQRLQEIQAAELERRKFDQDRKLHEAETILSLSKAIQQQFGELRATTGAGTQFLKYPKY